MTLTRANVEFILLQRAAKRMAFVGLDSTTCTGSNTSLNDPIGVALAQIGISVADRTNVTSADIAAVDSGDYDKLFDLAELRLLKNIQGNMDAVDIRVGQDAESLSQFGEQLDKVIDRAAKHVISTYGTGISAVVAGCVTYDFIAREDE